MPTPPATFTSVQFHDLVAVLVDRAVLDFASLQASAGASGSGITPGGINSINITASINATVNHQYDALFIDPVAIVDLTVAGSLMDLTSLLEGIVDWWVTHHQHF